jgi:GT2 family glycosyltransferase
MKARSEEPLISLITVNYNQPEVTYELLASLENLTYPNFEIWIVDNGSKKEASVNYTKGYSYPVHYIKSEKNLGFAGGNNLALNKATGDYLFLLNNDTEVTPNLLENLLEPFLDDPEIGVVCPKIKFYHQPNTIQYAGFAPMNYYTGRTFAYGSHQTDNGQFDTSQVTYGAHGAAMMLSRAVLDAVGVFDESYFLYYEEWDWSSRIMRAGFKIYYQAEATIYHKESISTGKGSPLKTYYLNRNRTLFIIKNSPLPAKFFFIAYALALATPKAIITFLKKKEYANLKALAKGWLWHIHPKLGSI